MGQISDIFAANLVAFRKKRGWTQAMLAEFSGLSQAGITHIETGQRWPSADTIEKIAKALGIDEFELFMPSDFKPEPSIEEAYRIIGEGLGINLPSNSEKNTRKKSRKNPA